MEEMLIQLRNEDRCCYIMGDYSINLLNWIYTDITNHFPIVHVDCSSNYNKPVKDSVQRNLSGRNKHASRETLATLDWKEIHGENNTQGAFSAFHSIVLKLYNKHCLKGKSKTTYTTHKLWLSRGFKESIEIKNKLFGKYRKIDSVENETKYIGIS